MGGLHNLRWLIAAICMLAPITATCDEQPVNWRVAVSTLAGERTRAEACASDLKLHGEPAEVRSGALEYEYARADFNELIVGLIIALDEDAEPGNLKALQKDMQQSFDKRLAFCKRVLARLPKEQGEKSGIFDLLGEVAASVIDAIAKIFIEVKIGGDRLTQKAIQTQLEATKWLRFSEISSPEPRSSHQ